jgi:short-subunit dehydrogenase
MNIEAKNIVVTGAAGGIGSEIARQLASRGANIALLDRDRQALQLLAESLDSGNAAVLPIATDLLDSAAREEALKSILHAFKQVDILINAAGLMSFGPFATETPVIIERIMQLNVIVPMMLTQKLLPEMQSRGTGKIVNISSIFGSIGFAWFSAYSASKFALRGFSEALRRELADTGVTVTHIAPRAVKTKLNTAAVYQMAHATGMRMDSPAWVAEEVIRAIQHDRKDVYLGFPESLFVRVNSLLPRLVDLALRKQNRTMSTFAKGEQP